MKCKLHFTLFLVILLLGCYQKSDSKSLIEKAKDKSELIENSEDKTAIQKLIRDVLIWANSENSFDLLPAISDSTDSIYIGFDQNKLKSNLKKFAETDLFSKEFIENYNRIILTLDKNTKRKVYYDWLVGDLQPFGFANDVNPWCYCQEMPYEDPSPWGLVEVTIIKLEKTRGEMTWTWGKTDWPDIKYNFSVVKENGKWKISYMEGFDYKEGIKED
jgi:hypothetical protein